MKFSKLQAAGNDFILVDARNVEQNWANLAQFMCRHHFGVGADGLIVVKDSQGADLKMRIFNPDGSEAEVCGNGLRCLSKYAIEKGIVGKMSLQPKQSSSPKIRRTSGSKSDLFLAIETLAGIRKTKAYMLGGRVNRVEVSMGIPQFLPDQIPVRFAIASEAKQSPILDYPLLIEGRHLTLALLSMGNPHAVSFLSEPIANFPLAEIGPKVETDPMFPQRTNFEVAKILSKEKIEARVWERGVGETLACGSGACAVAVAAQLLGYTDGQVDIILPGGILTVSWDGTGEVLLTGPVEEVFIGEWLT